MEDRFIAANSSYHAHEVAGLHPFYLGMWDGKPLEVAFIEGNFRESDPK
jgi:hypothetical protein